MIDLAEVVLKNNVFTFGKKTRKQKRGTGIGTKFAPPYSILLKESECKSIYGRGTLTTYFLWEHDEKD